ncbi:MAG: CPBP family intramembrane metalloprotease [Nitrospirota bacterium]|nr:CPBP family intramembrane metalloprotease [Nitrospirota bacterium]
MSHSSALASSTSPFSSTEPNPWLGAKGALLVLLGFILTSELLPITLRFSLGVFVGFCEGIVGTFSDAFIDELLRWTAPFFSILSMVGGVWAGMWIFFKWTKDQRLFQWLLKLVWQPGHGSFFMWPFFIGLSLGLSFYFFFPFYWFDPPSALPRSLPQQMINAPLIPQLLWILIFVAIAPFIEECLFRGILYAGFSQSWGTFWGGMMVTGIFVALHFPQVYVYPPAALAILCLGFATLWLRLRTHALASGIVCHMTYNALCVMGMFLFHSSS